MTIIAEFSNIEAGISVKVFVCESGYRVCIVDTDSGDTVPTFTTFLKKDEAIKFASKCAA